MDKFGGFRSLCAADYIQFFLLLASFAIAQVRFTNSTPKIDVN